MLLDKAVGGACLLAVVSAAFIVEGSCFVATVPSLHTLQAQQKEGDTELRCFDDDASADTCLAGISPTSKRPS